MCDAVGKSAEECDNPIRAGTHLDGAALAFCWALLRRSCLLQLLPLQELLLELLELQRRSWMSCS